MDVGVFAFLHASLFVTVVSSFGSTILFITSLIGALSIAIIPIWSNGAYIHLNEWDAQAYTRNGPYAISAVLVCWCCFRASFMLKYAVALVAMWVNGKVCTYYHAQTTQPRIACAKKC